MAVCQQVDTQPRRNCVALSHLATLIWVALIVVANIDGHEAATSNRRRNSCDNILESIRHQSVTAPLDAALDLTGLWLSQRWVACFARVIDECCQTQKDEYERDSFLYHDFDTEIANGNTVYAHTTCIHFF